MSRPLTIRELKELVEAERVLWQGVVASAAIEDPTMPLDLPMPGSNIPKMSEEERYGLAVGLGIISEPLEIPKFILEQLNMDDESPEMPTGVIVRSVSG